MKKILITLGIITMTSMSFGQIVGGRIVEDGRKMLTESDFTIESYKNGIVDCELAVNIKGDVESVRIVKSNVKSTPLEIRVKNHLKTFKFEPGTHFPKFHHLVIRMNIITTPDED